MKQPTNLAALLAAGGWGKLSHEFLSLKAKHQLRDKHGRFIKMNSLVRWLGDDGKSYHRGEVDGFSQDLTHVNVKESSPGHGQHSLLPKQLEVIKAVIPTAPGEPTAVHPTTLHEGDHVKVSKSGSTWKVNKPFVENHTGSGHGHVAVENADTGAPGKLTGHKDDPTWKVDKLHSASGEDHQLAGSEDDQPDTGLFLNSDGFKKVGAQAGSNSGGFYEAPDGTQYYIKKAQSEQHAANEIAAARIYQMAGINVPDVYLTDQNGEPAIASKVIPGLDKLYPGGKTDAATLAEGRKGFAMDAWLGNWDSIGLEYDNMMKDPQGHAVRVDTGGALLYRAQGSPKGGLFGDTVGETKTLRDKSMNQQAAKVFGGMTDAQLKQDVQDTVDTVDEAKVNHLIDQLPFSDQATKDKLKATLAARKDDLNKQVGIETPPTPHEPKAVIPETPSLSGPAGQHEIDLQKDPIQLDTKNIGAPTSHGLTPVTDMSALKKGDVLFLKDGKAVQLKDAPAQWGPDPSKFSTPYKYVDGNFQGTHVGSKDNSDGWFLTKPPAKDAFGPTPSSDLKQGDLVKVPGASGGTAEVIEPFSSADGAMKMHLLTGPNAGKDVGGKVPADKSWEKIDPASDAGKAAIAGKANLSQPGPGESVGLFGPHGAASHPAAAHNLAQGDFIKTGGAVYHVDTPWSSKSKSVALTDVKTGETKTVPVPAGKLFTKFDSTPNEAKDFTPNEPAKTDTAGAKVFSADTFKPPHIEQPKEFASFEQAGLENYVEDGGYTDINGFLRHGKKHELGYYSDSEELQKDVQALDSAIEDSVVQSDGIVYRGAGNGVLPSGPVVPGTILSDKGFLSTSADISIAKSFAHDNGDKADHVLFEIHVPAGARAIDMDKSGHGAHEHEFLFPRNTQLQVTEEGVHKDGTRYIVANLLPEGPHASPQAAPAQEGTPGAPDLGPGGHHGDAPAVPGEGQAPGEVTPGHQTAAEHLASLIEAQGVPMEEHGLNSDGNPQHLKSWLSTYLDRVYSGDFEETPQIADAVKNLADELGVPVPTDNAKVTKAADFTPASELHTGDKVYWNGKHGTVSYVVPYGDGTYNAMFTPDDGTGAKIAVLSADNLVPVTDALPAKPDTTPMVPIGSLSVGDTFQSNDKSWTITEIQNVDGLAGAKKLTVEDATGKEVTYSQPAYAMFHVTKKAAHSDSPSPQAPGEHTDTPTTGATLVPGSDHVYKDAQGEFVVTKNGHTLRVGDTVTSTKDGLTGKVVALEKGPHYVKVQGPDGKVKGRQMDTLVPAEKHVPEPTPAAPAPAAEKPKHVSLLGSSLAPGDTLTYPDGTPIGTISDPVAQPGGGTKWTVTGPTGSVYNMTLLDHTKYNVIKGEAPAAPDAPAPDATHTGPAQVNVGDKLVTKTGDHVTVVHASKTPDGWTHVQYDKATGGKGVHAVPPHGDEFFQVPETKTDAPSTGSPDFTPTSVGDWKVGDQVKFSAGGTYTIKTLEDQGDFVKVKFTNAAGDELANHNAYSKQQAFNTKPGAPSVEKPKPATPGDALKPGTWQANSEGFGSKDKSGNFQQFDDVVDAISHAESGGDAPSGEPQPVQAGSLKAGDKISDVDGDAGTIIQIETKDNGNLKVTYSIDKYPGEPFTANMAPSNTTWFKKTGAADSIETLKAPDHSVPDIYNGLQPGEKVPAAGMKPGMLLKGGVTGNMYKVESDPMPAFGVPGVYKVQMTNLETGVSGEKHIKQTGKYLVPDKADQPSTPDAPNSPVSPAGTVKPQDVKIGDWITLPDGETINAHMAEKSLSHANSTFLAGDTTAGGFHTAHVSNDTHLPIGKPDAAAAPAAPDTPAAPAGTLVPGSSHVYQDAQGRYVITSKGYILREGMQIISTKDGHAGTIHKFELGPKYAKVKGPDGKIKGRQIDTLKPVDPNAPKASSLPDVSGKVTPSAPSGGVHSNVNIPGEMPPELKGKGFILSGTAAPEDFKPGDIVGKNKQLVEWAKPNAVKPTKMDVKFKDQPGPLTLHKTSPWEKWETSLPGVTGVKKPGDFEIGDVVGQSEGDKKIVKQTSEWGDTPGHIEVLFQGDSTWHSIPEDAKYYTWPHGTSVSPASPAAPESLPETPDAPSGPVQLSHDPISHSFPEGGDVSIPAGGALYKGGYWSEHKPVLTDGFGNAWKVDPATGETTKLPSHLLGYYKGDFSHNNLLTKNENQPDVTPNIAGIFTPEELTALKSDVSKKANDAGSYGSIKSSFGALLKLLNDPSGASLSDDEWKQANNASANGYQIDKAPDNAQWNQLGLEILKAQKQATGTYNSEWQTSVSSYNQYHFAANERKALAALNLSSDAQALVDSKGTAPSKNANAAAEIHAAVSDPSNSAVLDDLFGHGTSALIRKKLEGNAFRPALSGPGSPHAKTAPELPNTQGKNGEFISLGDNVIAADGQGGQVVLVTADGKLRVRRSDGTHFTRKANTFAVTGTPVKSSKPTPKQMAEAGTYKPKPRPEFQVPDWSKGGIGGTSSPAQALEKIKQSNAAGNVGWSFAAGGSQVEDMDVHVARIKNQQGVEQIELKFKLTPKQGNASWKRHSADEAWTESNVSIEHRQTTSKNELAQLTGTHNFHSSGGVTMTKKLANGGEIKFHRAKSQQMNKSGSNPVAFHNMVQIRLPKDATQSDIAKAMYDAGVDDPSAPTYEDLKRLGENKLMSLFGRKTNAWTGNDSLSPAIRLQTLNEIEKAWGVTAADLEITQGTNGRFEIRLPQWMADKIQAKTKVNYFTHQLSGGQGDLHKKVGTTGFDALLSTSVRWSEGLKYNGSSSHEDVSTGGADYVFTRPKQTLAPLSGSIVFDASRLFTRMDWFTRTNDAWGQRAPTMDIIGDTSPNATETMFKHRLDLADAVGFVVSYPGDRQEIIKNLKAAGITEMGGRPVEDFIILAPNTNIKAPTPLVPTVPISSLAPAEAAPAGVAP